MALKEAFNLPCPFAGQERADGVDEAASGPHQLCPDVEQALLRRYHPIQALGSEPPSAFGIAPPCPAAGTRRVDEHEVRFSMPVGKLDEFRRSVEQSRLDLRPRAR